ncbi:ATP-dependent Clp protease ATP-binding subunit ClpA [Streptococcus sp. DD12]|nr:ATP-dependent Clp protease ATP-binding subunit ClpA [Streptococcus sp. DD12]
MMSVLAGTRFRGDFEERMNNIIAEIEADAHIILFVDELHTIMGSGSGMDSTLDAANILKPALARGTLHMVGATTQDEYQKHIEKDAALSRRFAKVLIEEPTTTEALAILQGLKEGYERFHHVQITDGALEAAVSGAKRYLTSKNLPDSAIDLIDEAASKVQNQQTVAGHGFLTDLDQAILDQNVRKANQTLKQLAATEEAENRHQVTEQVVLETLSQLSGIPVAKMTKSEAKKYLRLEEDLHKRVIGQDAAISAVSRAIRRNQSGIRTGKRPIGSFMFLGPTGVGKTELAKALAELLFDDESALIRFDMSEYMEKFAASRLNGAPPGYVGYDEGGELTEKVRNRPYSVLLFDEIEKAHPDTFNLLLQVLDDGVLTDSRGRQVDFSNTIIIMTSNLGATALRDDKTVGFGAQALVHDHEAMQKRILEELKRHYRPEFINRIDEKVVFHSLTDTDMKAVVKLMVKPLIAHLAEQGKTLKISAQALDHLAKEGYDPEMGARPLRRTLQTALEDPLAEWILSDDFKAGDTLKVGLKKKRLHFEKAQ